MQDRLGGIIDNHNIVVSFRSCGWRYQRGAVWNKILILFLLSLFCLIDFEIELDWFAGGRCLSLLLCFN